MPTFTGCTQPSEFTFVIFNVLLDGMMILDRERGKDLCNKTARLLVRSESQDVKCDRISPHNSESLRTRRVFHVSEAYTCHWSESARSSGTGGRIAGRCDTHPISNRALPSPNCPKLPDSKTCPMKTQKRGQEDSGDGTGR